MLRGVSKRVIIVKNLNSDLFDEAYFIVKEKSFFSQPKKDAMALEADRIIAAFSKQNHTNVKSRLKQTENKPAAATVQSLLVDDFDDYSTPPFRLSSENEKKGKLLFAAPPKSFFIGIGFMSGIIIIARIVESVLQSA